VKVDVIDEHMTMIMCSAECSEVARYRVLRNGMGAEDYCLLHASEIVQADPAWRVLIERGAV